MYSLEIGQSTRCHRVAFPVHVLLLLGTYSWPQDPRLINPRPPCIDRMAYNRVPNNGGLATVLTGWLLSMSIQAMLSYADTEAATTHLVNYDIPRPAIHCLATWCRLLCDNTESPFAFSV